MPSKVKLEGVRYSEPTDHTPGYRRVSITLEGVPGSCSDTRGLIEQLGGTYEKKEVGSSSVPVEIRALDQTKGWVAWALDDAEEDDDVTDYLESK
jgi:hypothetical protein